MCGTDRCARILGRSHGWSDGRTSSRPEAGTLLALKGYAKRAEEEFLEKAKEARVGLDETIERGEHFIVEKTADVEAAIKAGRESMKEKMDKCCS